MRIRYDYATRAVQFNMFDYK
ncbi:hypothetical protein TRIP_B330657 [uncultured Desulfatiglans sp.]|nr:hypothetical protein TRIP_B330657 [uncultured Desulfatiglans sp.]